MRKVIYKATISIKIGDFVHIEVKEAEALFHHWGLGVFGEGGQATSSAIIELEDGTVKNVPAEQIRFISGELDIKLKE